MIACYVACNEADVIAESLRSVKAYVERFVIVDAVFSANPLEATHSTDNQREVCERICAPVPLTYIEADRKLPQEAARNRYLDEVPDGEWVVNLDGDEVLYADYAEAREIMAWLQYSEDVRALNLPILSAAVLFEGYAEDMPPEHYATAPIVHSAGWAPRLFRKTPTMRYREWVSPQGIVDNQGLWEGRHLVASKGLRDSRMLIVNHHVRQSFESYRDDAIWETINLRPVAV